MGRGRREHVCKQLRRIISDPYPDAYPHRYLHQHRNAHTEPDGIGYANGNGYVDADGHSERVTHPERDSDGDPFTDCHGLTEQYRDEYSDSHAFGDAESDAVFHSDFDRDEYFDFDPECHLDGHSERHSDGHRDREPDLDRFPECDGDLHSHGDRNRRLLADTERFPYGNGFTHSIGNVGADLDGDGYHAADFPQSHAHQWWGRRSDALAYADQDGDTVTYRYPHSHVAADRDGHWYRDQYQDRDASTLCYRDGYCHSAQHGWGRLLARIAERSRRSCEPRRPPELPAALVQPLPRCHSRSSRYGRVAGWGDVPARRQFCRRARGGWTDRDRSRRPA